STAGQRRRSAAATPAPCRSPDGSPADRKIRGPDKSGELPQIPEQDDDDAEPEQQLPQAWRPMRPVLILSTFTPYAQQRHVSGSARRCPAPRPAPADRRARSPAPPPRRLPPL